MKTFLIAFLVATGILIGATAGPLASSAANTRAIDAEQDGSDLPDGDGKKILLSACTACHDLKEVTKFRGYYSKDEWRDIVKTMIEYGAVVKEKDADVLVEYLARVLGKN